MTSYRRGYKDGVWDRFWHWNEQCAQYPSGTCIMQKDRPPAIQLCFRCLDLDRRGLTVP